MKQRQFWSGKREGKKEVHCFFRKTEECVPAEPPSPGKILLRKFKPETGISSRFWSFGALEHLLPFPDEFFSRFGEISLMMQGFGEDFFYSFQDIIYKNLIKTL